VSPSIATNQTILGGGISGMTAALEAAECGKQVKCSSLKASYLDGHVIQPKKLQDIAGK
jgi:quinone-modifying oxidoreductase subunit QmoA